MDHYEIWCNLRDSRKDLEFADAVHAMLSSLQEEGRIREFRMARRKLGFGPSELGEFRITISTDNLSQLDDVWSVFAARTGPTEEMHIPVYQLATDFRAGLYRDFPDPQRSRS